MLMAAIMMVMGAFVSLIDVGFYQNWIHTDIGHWLDSEVVGVRCGQIFDSLSAVMLVVVSLISLVVYIYSIDYLATDPFAARFVAYLLIFTFLMLVYVTADTSITCVSIGRLAECVFCRHEIVVRVHASPSSER